MNEVTSSIIKYRFVSNRQRKFGSDLGYVPALIENEVGGLTPALFTREQINDAITRAKTNPEDAPIAPWYRRWFG